jgi:hypothetical protein
MEFKDPKEIMSMNEKYSDEKCQIDIRINSNNNIRFMNYYQVLSISVQSELIVIIILELS